MRDVISVGEEQRLLEWIRALAFGEVRMKGVTAKRRVVHFGWRYGYESWKLTPALPVPDWLSPLQQHAATLANVAVETLGEALITEYPEGSGIGWHRDAPVFGPAVVGFSLLGPCRMRFRRTSETGRATFVLPLDPRSAYILSGPARSQWQHMIPPTPGLRYSITFRMLRQAMRRVETGSS
ncbi:alpha-ketoglutarate-dependent dioxygenase AlkB [Candidatus Nitrospira bockiana]